MPAPKRYRVAVPAYVFVTVTAKNARDAADAARMYASAHRDEVREAGAPASILYGVEPDSSSWGFKRGAAPSVESKL